MELGEYQWGPLVVVGSPKKVIENLKNDGYATPRMADATTALTARGQSAWWVEKRVGGNREVGEKEELVQTETGDRNYNDSKSTESFN